MSRHLLVGLLAVALPAPPLALAGQEPGSWDAPAALELVERARAVRQATAVDSTFRSYRARANGFVYFFMDRPDEAEHTLIKADQLALDVFWQAPARTRQRILGRRDEKLLPTNVHYHLDHLTVVQDDFGDVIRVGDGDEVAAVVHPVAPGSEQIYQYRVVDSLTLTYAGQPEPIRVHHVQVRPRNTDGPGFVGGLYLDRSSGAIVRMSFTFTPASYVDGYLDYIRISLENALWLGKHWLPYRQEVELRRELPQLDFLAATVIRGRWEIGDYAFNEDLPDLLFRGPRVTQVSQRARDAFPFEEGLFDDLADEGLAPSPTLTEIEAEVREMAMERALSALAPVRLHVAHFSDAIRYNRAEGWALGLGTSVKAGTSPVRLVGGYAFSAGHPWARISADRFLGVNHRIRVTGRWNELRDVGPVPGASRVVNTLGSLGGQDYLDPFWVRGGQITWRHRAGQREREFSVSARVEDHRSAALNADDANTAFRPVRPIREGTLSAVTASLHLPEPAFGPFGGVELTAGTLSGGFTRALATLGWARGGPERRVDLTARLRGGWTSSGTPAQGLFLMGGRETLPGFPYRGAVGDRFVLADLRLGGEVWSPWLSAHLTGAVGWSRLDAQTVPAGWAEADPEPGIRSSLGAGVDLLWEVLRLDVVRGLPDGDWSLIFSVHPRFHPWL